MTGAHFVNTVIYPDLTGKTAVITGGSRGIGAGAARALARNRVAVSPRTHRPTRRRRRRHLVLRLPSILVDHRGPP